MQVGSALEGLMNFKKLREKNGAVHDQEKMKLEIIQFMNNQH